ncbi:cytochrome c biogenesis protein CcsA [Flavobacterium sp. IMCC34852]|uniref:Cytochrome c biogenesis protein CcsA n=1 Tax=Flavobacterium rivulicola TaxID=2732161 RepID=A0A7Y3RB11_9FLAO|nr:cytochrome c biogenesis protein CcsA [Flavobacterium sp. IMCC34852]NNT73108.1 cytochrome c biogenesis protein CcsA [Flavobacterium sp. IMCC34852]
MEKKIYSLLSSTRLMAFLFLGFAVAMAAGTFIESKYNTDTARILVYNAWWFEGIMLFFMINFIGNIKRYQLYKKEKWATLLLHLSFIFIIAGAFITRYISYEGMMPIREGASSNQIYSDKCFLTVYVDGMYDGKMMRRTFEKPMLLSPVTNNHFSIDEKFAEIPFEIEYKNFALDAKEVVKADAKGDLYLKLVESGDGTRHEHMLKAGEVQNIHNVLFALDKPTKGAINIDTKTNTITSPFDGQFMRMADKMQGKVTKDVVEPLMYRSLYNMGGTQFVIPELPKRGIKIYEPSGDFRAKNGEDALTVVIKTAGKEEEVTLLGSKGKQGEPKSFKLGQLEFTLIYGSKVYELPFSLKLNDFIAAKYPGTEKSYSSFESKVTVLDGSKKEDAHIYMNHILDYRGYRFFQANFDPDEKGTVLSVNHDFWGTTITYIGYFLLFFCMMAILFVKNTRFADLKRKLDNVKRKKAKLMTILVLLFSFNGFAQNHAHQAPTGKINFLDSILYYKVPEKQASQFGKLIIQDAGGRMKPINTFASELLRKVSHSDNFNGMNSDQVFLSMKQFPFAWIEVPLVYVKTGNDSIRKILGVDSGEKLIPFKKFFDGKGNYKLGPYLEEAYKTANPNQFEKDFVETDKKINLMNSALFGSILKIYPIPNDKNNKWVSNLEISHNTGTVLDTVKNAFPYYLESLTLAAKSKDYTMANTMLTGIETYQKKYGKAVMPSEKKVEYEILYNKFNIFKRLPYWYISVAALMFLFVIIQIFKDRKWLRIAINISHIAIALLFLLHTLGLIARWYISGHAPWSNAYESIIYVAWAAMFFGLAFDLKIGKRSSISDAAVMDTFFRLFYIKSSSKLTVASSAFVTAMILTAAYANWIDPEIANLQPVLNSYWLMIHVAVIVASYGPFALGAILGFVTLLLMCLTNKNNKTKMELNIKELTYINEMALTVGLVMLTIGNFLGGQWANESWGRYWGWDPKETWALISIMVYAFVIHARFVPALRNKWFYNLMAMYAFVSILFTYYGVNFHLVGLHSYASGEAKSLSWIWMTLGGMSLIGALAYPSYRKYYSKK